MQHFILQRDLLHGIPPAAEYVSVLDFTFSSSSSLLLPCCGCVVADGGVLEEEEVLVRPGGEPRPERDLRVSKPLR